MCMHVTVRVVYTYMYMYMYIHVHVHTCTCTIHNTKGQCNMYIPLLACRAVLLLGSPILTVRDNRDL